jgi:hypothetical protein
MNIKLSLLLKIKLKRKKQQKFQMSINKTTVKKALTLASVPNDQDTDDYTGNAK